MYIYSRFIGRDFVVESSAVGKVPFDSPELAPYRNTIDLRTNYVCIRFSGNHNDPLQDCQWYKNYLALQAYLVNEGSTDKVAGFYKNQSYSLLRLGFVPIGFCPSFAPEMTIALTRILEQKKIKYIKAYPTSFVHPFYKSAGNRDIWISKLDGAEILGCAPEAVTSVALFERIIS